MKITQNQKRILHNLAVILITIGLFGCLAYGILDAMAQKCGENAVVRLKRCEQGFYLQCKQLPKE